MIDKKFISSLPPNSGVYQILDEQKKIIYVGKAKNLKKRLSQYYTGKLLDSKTSNMVKNSRSINYIITETELEAFLLESRLIKQHRPKYNIIMRDDKSFPYIVVTKSKFPAILITRKKNLKGNYFGPYIHQDGIRKTLDNLQKIIPFRQCKDSFFRNRVRPCLEYQIKRCNAPCVGLVTEAEYQENIDLIQDFLQGSNFSIIKNFSKQMELASNNLDFEKAANLRDKISTMRSVQVQPTLNQITKGNKDYLVLLQKAQKSVIHILQVRGETIVASNSHFPIIPHNSSASEIVESFMSQYYSTYSIPKSIYVNFDLKSKDRLSDFFSKLSARNISIFSSYRGINKKLISLALKNAEANLEQNEVDKKNHQKSLQEIKKLLNVKLPRRMECFDISHTQGKFTLASCVVFIDGVAEKLEYRRYNLNVANDDYLAMRTVLARRYSKISKDKIPDLVVIDGGKGQLSQAIMVLDSLGLSTGIVSIAKGENRKAGLETLFTPNNLKGIKSDESSGFRLLMHIRDEAHRFAITGHRKKIVKNTIVSTLEEIDGIGRRTRQKLLQHFGGLQQIKLASTNELIKVDGVSQALAEKIVDFYK